jgi:hypothetical protein
MTHLSRHVRQPGPFGAGVHVTIGAGKHS